ncbi:unnamed protein product [Dibothriocephalus latus]|uniref:Uncharacterized protein n=1 Tax=Dibothriocephalus latus TaxID=60516 RepID=A0A3P7P1P9_DIBLA|nr:unnamed protein product [Dibothriocephalus latus]
MEVKDQQFENLCNNALELRNQIKERIEKKERKRKMKKQTRPIQCKGYLQELMAKLADVSSSLSQLYQDPRDVSSADDYMRFSNYLRDGLQYTLEQITKFLEGSSKNFESSQLSAFITKLHHM